MTNEQFTQAVTDLIDRTKHDAKTGGALAWRQVYRQPNAGDTVLIGGTELTTAKVAEVLDGAFVRIAQKDGDEPIYDPKYYRILESDRSVRIAEMDRLIERYFSERGEMPENAQIERLADLCLREELTDINPHQMSVIEYPFMSETQMARRQEGVHKRKSQAGEVPLKAAHDFGMDGARYKPQTRRKRNTSENIAVDKAAKSRNAERNRIYREFTRVQPVEIRSADDIK